MYHILLNPVSAGGKSYAKYKETAEYLDSKGIAYILHESTLERSLTDITEEICASDKHVNIIAIGGDGSCNKIASGIKDYSKVSFGIIPSGSGNDLIKNFDIPKDPKEYLDYLFNGEIRHHIDVPEVTFCGDGKTIRRRYLISTELGFGAEVCYRGDHSSIKGMLNKLSAGSLIYLIEAVISLAAARPYNQKIICDGKEEQFSCCLSTIVMNGCYEGGGMKYCPQAKFDDGYLDIVFGSELSKLRFAGLLPRTYSGNIGNIPGVYYRKAKEVTIESDIPQCAHTDGEAVDGIKKITTRITGEQLGLLF